MSRRKAQLVLFLVMCAFSGQQFIDFSYWNYVHTYNTIPTIR